MPRRLLRDGLIALDEWRYLGQDDGDGEAVDDAALIVPFDRWLEDRGRWLERRGPIGVVLAAAHRVEDLAADLGRFALIGAEFSGPGEGRGYTQGRLLRERWKFRGELRAVGYVRRDQLFLLARCGFNSFELPDGEIECARAALATFSARYQPANDSGLPLKLQHR
jgi:uncharacterized protein (DUF934 family)